MRIIILISLLAICLSESEKYEDVIYLIDGSVIYGVIIEIKPNVYYKIKSARNKFVFQLDEINIKVSASQTKMQNVPLRIYLRNEYTLCSTGWYKKRELYSEMIF